MTVTPRLALWVAIGCALAVALTYWLASAGML